MSISVRVFIHKILSTIQTLNKLHGGFNNLFLLLLTYSVCEKKEGGEAKVHQLIVGRACEMINVLDIVASVSLLHPFPPADANISLIRRPTIFLLCPSHRYVYNSFK